MIVLDGEARITARESCARAGYRQDLADMKRRGRLAAKLARDEGLPVVDVPAPPGLPWPTEHAWPERIWLQVAWDLWWESGAWRGPP